MVAKLAVELAESVVKAPVDGVVAPTVVPLTVPPVMTTAEAFCVAIVPKPETWADGIKIATLVATESCPLARTVNCGTSDAEPYVPAVTPVGEMLPEGTESVCQEGADVVPLEVRT